MPRDYVDEEQIEKWVTIRGHRVPIYKGDSEQDVLSRLNKSMNKNGKATADEKTQAEHQQAIAELDKSEYPDGTYDIGTKKTVDFENGYQVTFCQIGDNYTPAEYAKKVNECLSISSNGRTYAGKFGGTPEISFHCNSREKAVEYGRKNNQESVLDWAELQKANKLGDKYGWDSPQYLEQLGKAFISTGGTGRRG